MAASPERTVVIPGNGRQPEVDHHWPVGPEQDIGRLEVAMHHPGGMHCAQRGQRSDGDALECTAAARPELLHDLDQRWPADVFTDNERPPFEDPRVQNLRGAEPGDPLRCGDLLQKAAPDLRVGGWRQSYAAGLPVGLSARNTTPCPPSPRRPSSLYTPTSRGSVSRRASMSGIADQADVTRPFSPLAAQRTPPFHFINRLKRLSELMPSCTKT